MTIRVWIAASLLGLLLSSAHAMAAAQTVDRVEYEGTAQLRSETELTLKLVDGELLVIPSKTISQLDAVPPGALIQLRKTTAVPGTAEKLAAKASGLAEEAKKEADRAKATVGEKSIVDEANAKAKKAQAEAEKAATDFKVASDNERPLQASVVGAQIVGTVQQVADDQSWLVVRTPQPPKRPWPATWDIDALLAAGLVGDNADKGVLVSIQVATDLRTLVTSLRSGDGVKIVYKHLRSEGSVASGDGSGTSINTLKQLEWRKARVTRGLASVSFLVSAVLLLVVATGFTKGRPADLFLGEDNRYSTSKFQTVLWFWVVISTYLAIVVLRWTNAGWDYIGGVDIPTNLLVLSGLSVLGAAGAKLITTSKVETAKNAVGPAAVNDPKPPADKPKPGDLINDDFNRTDLGDFQLVTVTAIAAVMYVLSSLEFMTVIELRRIITMPEVDATLLALFGLSQAGYLGKKVAGDAGAGMTPQQAMERADVLVTSIKADTKRVEAAENLVSNQVSLVNVARSAATAAATKTVAKDSVVQAKSAADAAAKAEGEATQTFKSVQAQLADLNTLASTWSKDLTVKPRMEVATTAAKAEFARAEAANKRATEKAKNVKSLAEDTQAAADAKPP